MLVKSESITTASSLSDNDVSSRPGVDRVVVIQVGCCRLNNIVSSARVNRISSCSGVMMSAPAAVVMVLLPAVAVTVFTPAVLVLV